MKPMTDSKTYGQQMIADAEFLSLDFAEYETPTMVYFTCPEGTSICPRSGFPDFWTAHIWYVPRKHIVELKSLKLYLNRFRDQAHYHETLAQLILQEFREKLKPQYVKIVMDYTRRGNIQTDVMVEYRCEGYQGPTAPEWRARFNHR